jgi:hypothetical protein
MGDRLNTKDETEEKLMKRANAVIIALATILTATSAYAAQLPFEIQAPRGQNQDIQAPRDRQEDIQAPRDHPDDIQLPRSPNTGSEER